MKGKKYSDDDILEFENVPMTVAATYLKTCPATLRAAMQKGLCPFGVCAGTAYIIPSERLVKWKHGEDSVIIGNVKLLELMRDTVLEAVEAVEAIKNAPQSNGTAEQKSVQDSEAV